MNARPIETASAAPDASACSIAVRVWKPPTQITGMPNASLKRRA
jgi:hypothetical protein